MNLIKQFTNSLWNFKSYQKLSKMRGGKSFLYIFLLFTLIFTIFSVSFVLQFRDIINHMQIMLEEDVPNFQLSEGKLSFDGTMPYTFEDDEFIFIIDTTGQTQPEDISHAFNAILLMENAAYIVNQGRMEITPFSNIPIETSRDELVQFLPKLMLLVYIGLFIWYLLAFAGKLFGILMLTLITMIGTAIFNQKLSFGNQWNIAIYASTLPILIKLIHSLLGAPIGGLMFLIYWGLAITYAFVAVHSLPKHDANLNNDLQVQPE